MIPESVSSATNNTTAAMAAGAELAASFQQVNIQGVPFTLAPNNLKLEAHEHLLPAPMRLKQHVSLTTPKAFIDYVNLFGEIDRSIVFANSKDASFLAVLDYHSGPKTPAWGSHRAAFKLVPTLALKEWLEKNKTPMNQADFSRFLEDHIPDIADPPAADLVFLSRNFEAKKAINFSSAIRVEDGSVQLQYTEDVQGTSRSGAMKIPALFKVVIRPFEGTAPELIEARLRYTVGTGGSLALSYDLVRVQDVIDRAFIGVYDHIAENTNSHVRAVVLGGVQ